MSKFPTVLFIFTRFNLSGIKFIASFARATDACRLLSLSTNMVDKITGLSGMKNLRILSLGRNYIKQISGLEAVAETLEELWLSYNLIEKLKGLAGLKKLRVLYLSNNQVKDWQEFNRLQEIPTLENLLFIGNPLVEGMDEALWKAEITKVTIILGMVFTGTSRRRRMG